MQVGTCDTDRDTRSKKPLNFVRRFKGLVKLVANQGDKVDFLKRLPRLARRGSEPKNWWSTGLDPRILARFSVDLSAAGKHPGGLSQR